MDREMIEEIEEVRLICVYWCDIYDYRWKCVIF